MQLANYLYMIFLTVAFCGIYILLFFLFPYFFQKQKVKITKRSIISVVIIIVASILVYLISYNLADEQLGNRILHIFGGGFLAFLACFLSARDSEVKITKFQFFVFSFLFATSMGVANELAEFFLQTTTGTMFTDGLTDTWLDLTSNTVGALIAAALLTPLFNREN